MYSNCQSMQRCLASIRRRAVSLAWFRGIDFVGGLKCAYSQSAQGGQVHFTDDAAVASNDRWRSLAV